MSEINILDSVIFNRIAAGEVVENPRSVVKELVENSIDAGASAITVEIRSGGIEYIAVSDNGKGLGREDMALAFLPHATSKIRSLEDLNAIATLGFRGEALPSIASVARITMISRREDDAVGYTVSYENGSLTEEGEIGAAIGTTVRVGNLFQNIPARRKFLKKPASEASRITDLMKRLILANPDISFEYLIDGTTVYRTDGKGPESAVYAIYGEESDQLAPIFDSMSHIKLFGFVSKPPHSKHNRNDQTLIVNNRVVENEEIDYSMYLAYKDFLMTRRYPAFVLYIEIPHDLIDVNVHPNKMRIKFVDITAVKKMIYHAVRRVIAVPTEFPVPSALDYGQEQGGVFNAAPKAELPSISQTEPSIPPKKNVNADSIKYPSAMPLMFDSIEILREESPAERASSRQKVMEQFEQEQLHDTEYAKYISKPISQPQTKNPTFDTLEQSSQIRIAGKLFQTYVLIQSDDEVYVIDQHAAHERILYDRYMAQIENKQLAVQELLIPYTFSVSHEEAQLLYAAQSDLQAIGFHLNIFGECTFALSAVPVVCADLNLQDFVQELLSNPLKTFNKSDFLKEKIAQAACKAAIKGKTDLHESEISALLHKMHESGSVPLCPHGRPTFIKFTKLEIDKRFKRVLS